MAHTSWYRQLVWKVKGYREYTKTGYEAAKSGFKEADLEVDCSDRHYMITGANSGLGLTTAVEIARRGGVLHLVCRNASAMQEARSHIITTTGNDKIHQHQVNLSQPAEVTRWAQSFAQSPSNRLDVLINNAGCMVHDRVLDGDGIESNFAVNVLAIHIITLTLMPLLQRSADPRVVTVSSGGMLTVKLNRDDLSSAKMSPFDAVMAYAQHKRQQVVMNFLYAQRFLKVKFFCMHPGWADTPAVRTAMPKFYEMMKTNLRTPLEGADTIIWLAVSVAATKHSSGRFFQDRSPASAHLPLAWTRSSIEDEQVFMSDLDDLYNKFCARPDPDAISEFVPDEPGPAGEDVIAVQRVMSAKSIGRNPVESSPALEANPFEDDFDDALEETVLPSAVGGGDRRHENGGVFPTGEATLPPQSNLAESDGRDNGELSGSLEGEMNEAPSPGPLSATEREGTGETELGSATDIRKSNGGTTFTDGIAETAKELQDVKLD